MSLQVKISNTLLKDGDEFQISITPNTDGYLYFFDFLSDSSIALVVPNQDMKDNFSKPGRNGNKPWERSVIPTRKTRSRRCISSSAWTHRRLGRFQSNRNADNIVFSAGMRASSCSRTGWPRAIPSAGGEDGADTYI
jgi:hypothetical protein